MGPVERVVTHRVASRANEGFGTDGAVGRQVNVRQVIDAEEGPASDIYDGIKAGDFAQLHRFIEGMLRNLGDACGPLDTFQPTVGKRRLCDGRDVGHACDRGDSNAPNKGGSRDARHARRHEEGSGGCAWAARLVVRLVACVTGAARWPVEGCVIHRESGAGNEEGQQPLQEAVTIPRTMDQHRSSH